jgi:hypothetical protein
MKSSIKSIKPLGFQWQTQDPFLFCAYHHDIFPEGSPEMSPNASLTGRNIGQDFSGKDGWSMYHGSKVPGFPAHPHKGFETVTIVENGLVDHSDSLGAAGRFGNGDTQWMTAGAGVMHSEMFPLLNEADKNELLLFQIWLNLPKAKKQVPAHFKMMWNEQIPIHHQKDENGLETIFKIISGKLGETHSLAPAPDSYAADPNSEVGIWLINADANGTFTLPEVSPGVNRTLFFYEGEELFIEEKNVRKGHGIELGDQVSYRIKNGNLKARFLYLQGKPINEKVVQHGPFVMNSNQEIQEAVGEFQRTQFGGWPWKTYENVHEKAKGRFAIHADGKLETK